MGFDFLRPNQVNSKIRLGRCKDGGYVLDKDSLDYIDVVYSYGVGWEVSFEKALYNKTKKPVRLFDPTMFDLSNIPYNIRRGAFWITKYLAKVVYFQTYLLMLRAMGYKLKFYNEGLASGKGNKYDSFANHLKRIGDNGKKVLLKIDIEGGEYEMFRNEDFRQSLNNVVQIAIEFHDLKTHLDDLEQLIGMLSVRFSIVHFHANNFGGTFDRHGKSVPHTIELTFLNNNYLNETIPDQTPIPIAGLDYPNDLKQPEIDLSNLFT